MKSIFKSNAPIEERRPIECYQPTKDLTTSPPSGVPKMQNPPPPPKLWKSYGATSRSDATAFLNEHSITPSFMVPGSNSQIFIFYKS